MRDLIRFVWRGALGGAIVPSLFCAYYLLVFFDAPLFWYALIASYSLAIPGAVVGAVLWLCALVFQRLGIFWRVTIGMATTSSFLVMNWIISAETFSYNPQFLRELLFSTIYCLVIGGIAGWACPAARIYRKEREPPYWERVREYEAAQAEHEFWKAQLASGKSREDKRTA